MNQFINTSSFNSVCLNSSLTGFCSTFLHVLGLIDYCIKFESNFILPSNKELWFTHYKKTHSGEDCSLYDCVFSQESFSRLCFPQSTKPKPYHAVFNVPPSADPIFNLSMLTSNNGYITQGWRETLHACLPYVSFAPDLLSQIKEDSERFHTKESVVGVHIRGTDIDNHGTLGPIEDRLKRLSVLTQNYDKIFLATDEVDILNRCKEIFGSRLLFLDTCIRSESKVPIHEAWKHQQQFDSVNNLTSLIREVSLLSFLCDHLVLSRSSVGLLALIMNPKITYDALDKFDKDHDVFKFRDAFQFNMNMKTNGNTINFY